MSARLGPLCLLLMLLAILSLSQQPVSTDVGVPPVAIEQLKSRIEEATKSFQDLTMVGVATYKDKKALKNLEPAYEQLYEADSATISLKMPDKLRIQSKIGMLKGEYIINGGKKIVRLPLVRYNKVNDYSKDPAKLQDALDIGLVTYDLWRNRLIEVVDDAEAATSGEIKLRLRWPKGNVTYYGWIDAKDLWLKRFEKHGGQGKLLLKIVYSGPQKVGNVLWMPSKVEMYAPDGRKAGASEYRDIRVNTGLADSLFQ